MVRHLRVSIRRACQFVVLDIVEGELYQARIQAQTVIGGIIGQGAQGARRGVDPVIGERKLPAQKTASSVGARQFMPTFTHSGPVKEMGARGMFRKGRTRSLNSVPSRSQANQPCADHQ